VWPIFPIFNISTKNGVITYLFNGKMGIIPPLGPTAQTINVKNNDSTETLTSPKQQLHRQAIFPEGSQTSTTPN